MVDWGIFASGFLGAAAPEIVRFYKLRTQGVPHVRLGYFIVSVFFFFLGGILALILQATTYYAAFYIGVSAPVLISGMVGKPPPSLPPPPTFPPSAPSIPPPVRAVSCPMCEAKLPPGCQYCSNCGAEVKEKERGEEIPQIQPNYFPYVAGGPEYLSVRQYLGILTSGSASGR